PGPSRSRRRPAACVPCRCRSGRAAGPTVPSPRHQGPGGRPAAGGNRAPRPKPRGIATNGTSPCATARRIGCTRTGRRSSGGWRARSIEMFIELHAASAFSFLDGASLPETLVARAAALDMPAIAILDRDGVYGAPRAHQAAKAAGVRALVGAELTIRTGTAHDGPPPPARGPARRQIDGVLR